LKIYISQGSVTTHIRCGGIGLFSNHFITNFPQNVTCGRKKMKIGQYLASNRQKFAVYFWGHPVGPIYTV